MPPNTANPVKPNPHVLTHAQALATFPVIAAYINEKLLDCGDLDVYNTVVDKLAQYKEEWEDDENQDPAAHDNVDEFKDVLEQALDDYKQISKHRTNYQEYVSNSAKFLMLMDM